MAPTAKVLIRNVATAMGSETVAEAAKKMKKANIGCLVVVEGKVPVGIFSERDMVKRVVAEGRDPARTPLSEVMTVNPVTVDSSEPLVQVFTLLAERKFRHVPITTAGNLVGIASLSDVARLLPAIFADEKHVKDFVDSLNEAP